MGLFDMKFCAICGEEIGLLGKKKVEDGVICKKCTAKLSPWFTERKKSTVAEIEAQLEYRKKNAVLLRSFAPTKTYGHKTKVYLDERLKKFIVTASSNWRDQNPDLIELARVRTCDIEVQESRSELFDVKEDGTKESFDPKKYAFEYTYRVRLGIDSVYFPEIRFELTDEKPNSRESALYKKYEAEGKVLQAALLPGRYSVDAATIAVAEGVAAAEANDTAGVTSNTTNGTTNAANDTVSQAGAGTSAAALVWTCTCGKVNDGNFCSACGSKKPERWFCPDCGKENFGKFCIACGHAKPE